MPRTPIASPTTSANAFHTTAVKRTRLRRNMFSWLNGPGAVFRKPLPNSSNYLSAYNKQGQLLRARPGSDQEQSRVENESETNESEANAREQPGDDRGGLPKERLSDLRPYPLNRDFRSQPVLSEELRLRIHSLVAEQGIDLKSVSAAFGVDIRRVAAVVRLVALEKEWIKQGKPLAKPYNDAVLAMLPKTPLHVHHQQPHEPINDLPVHPYTRQQIFVPTSESRAFTRDDAAEAFHPRLLPADERIAHPELLQIAKWEKQGYDRETRHKLTRELDAEAASKRALKEKKQKEWERRTQVVVPGRRWDFRFQDISAENVEKDGRGRRAVGIRYGMPHEDRKKGQVKIPTSVE